MANCYGNYSTRRTRCHDCELAMYCRDAGDPAPDLQGRIIEYDTIEYAEEYAVPAEPLPGAIKKSERAMYTRSDLLEAISFLVCLDAKTLEFLDAKINDPSVSFADLAKSRRISRQAVHKFISKRCREVPELEPFLHNRQNRNRQGGTNNFMEAVCQIKQQTFKKRSEKQNENSRFSGTLMSLTRNLDLSRMSICKGDRSCVPD